MNEPGIAECGALPRKHIGGLACADGHADIRRYGFKCDFYMDFPGTGAKAQAGAGAAATKELQTACLRKEGNAVQPEGRLPEVEFFQTDHVSFALRKAENMPFRKIFPSDSFIISSAA